MEGGDGGWRGGGAIIFIYFFSGGEGGRETLLFCVYSNSFVCLRKKMETQFIRMSSNSIACLPIHWRGVPPPNQYYYFAEIKGGTLFIRTSSNSFVCLPPQKKPEPQFIRMSSNSFIYSKKNTASQFLRLYSNSFVCLPIHSYVFSAGMVGGGRGWWVEGGERLYLFIFSRGGGGARNIIILCVFQCIRKSSNSFVCLRKKVETQFIRMSSNSLGGVAPPEPGLLFRGSFVCLPIHGIGWGYPPEPLLLFRGNNNNESISSHYYYLAEIIIMKRHR